MKVLRLAAIALFSLAPLAVCAQSAPSTGKDVAARAEVGAAVTAVGADSFAGISVPFAGGVRGYPDVVYETLLGYRPMKLDLFLPPPSFAAKGPRPVIVYIHGGGWVGGGPRRSSAYSDWPKVLASMAEHGYVVASVSYRFAGEAPFPAAIQDVKAAIRFLRANSAKYGIDSVRDDRPVRRRAPRQPRRRQLRRAGTVATRDDHSQGRQCGINRLRRQGSG